MNTEGYEMTEREAIAMLHTMTARYPEARIMYLLGDRWNVEAGLRCVFPDGQQGFCPFGSEIALAADAVLGHEIWFEIPIDTAGFGLSTDNIIDLKSVLHLTEEHAKDQGVTLYVIAAANTYEMARGERCLEPKTGKFMEFSDYESYRRFCLNSRKRKERRDGIRRSN